LKKKDLEGRDTEGGLGKNCKSVDNRLSRWVQEEKIQKSRYVQISNKHQPPVDRPETDAAGGGVDAVIIPPRERGRREGEEGFPRVARGEERNN